MTKKPKVFWIYMDKNGLYASEKKMDTYDKEFRVIEYAAYKQLKQMAKDYKEALKFYAQGAPDVYDVSDADDPLHFDNGEVAIAVLKKHRKNK